MTNGTIVKPASYKQLVWLRSLLASKDFSDFPEDWRAWCEYIREAFTRCVGEGYEAGSLNTWLVANNREQVSMETFQTILPKLQAAKAVEPVYNELLRQTPSVMAPIATTDGMFKKGDTFYKLRFAKTGKLWAHRLVFLLTPEQLLAKQTAAIESGIDDKTSYVKFKFAGAPQSLGIREDMRLTDADAKVFGALYGMCSNCGRLLTNEVSINLGIGPKCGKRQFGGEFKFMINTAKLAVGAANQKGK